MRRGAKLPRTLGTGALFAACYGNVGSSIYYALGVTALYALGLTPLAFLFAGAIFITTALNYAEGTAAVPQAGGSSSFARRAFNEPIGWQVGWVQLLNYTATVSISAYTGIAYLSVFPIFHILQNDEFHAIATVALIGFLILLNIVGIQESSFVNLSLAMVDLATQVVLVLLGLILLPNLNTVIHHGRWGVAPTWGNFLASISIAMVSYTGIETISNMSEEARNPGRTVPRATFYVIAAVLFVSAFLPTIGVSVFPIHLDQHGKYVTDLGTKWANDPVAGIVTAFRPAALAYWAGVWVAILAFTILVIATNAGLIGISRLSYSLATYKLMPRPFAALHPRFRTPYIAQSTYIFIGWFVLGVAAFIAYRKYTRQFLWEPLASPPPVDREVARGRLVAPPAARVRLKHRERIADQVLPAPEEHHRHRRLRVLQLHAERMGWLRTGLAVAICLAICVLAVAVDLSSLDPTGPGLGWSPGVLMVAGSAAYLLLRSRTEE